MLKIKHNLTYVNLGQHDCTLVDGKILILARVSEDRIAPDFLGGKGYSLCAMVSCGFNVPPAVILPVTMGKEWLSSIQTHSEFQHAKVNEILEHPFVVDLLDLKNSFCSVRSGAAVSMAGMMDTILNVGALDKEVLSSFTKKYKDVNFARDCKNRFIETYSSALGTNDGVKESFTKAMEELRLSRQYFKCIDNVFKSFYSPRAVFFRGMNGLSDITSTACIIQKMVFGNMNDQSCTGVVFSRNPTTGEDKLTGEFLVKAQGEDVVAGKITPKNLDEMWHWNKRAYTSLKDGVSQLEELHLDVVDVEFTVQDGELFFLQCRSAKRTAEASIRIFKGMMSTYSQVDQLTLKTSLLAKLDPSALAKMRSTQVEVSAGAHTYTGLGVCAGAVVGKACFSLSELQQAKSHVARIYIATETTPEDLPCFALADGIITMRGGATSHAAVVARAMGIPCIVGAAEVATYTPHGSGFFTMCGETGRIWDDFKVVVDKGTQTLDEFMEYLAPVLGYTLVPELHSIGSLIASNPADISKNSFARLNFSKTAIISDDADFKAFKFMGGVGDPEAQLEKLCLGKGVTTLDTSLFTAGAKSDTFEDLLEYAASQHIAALSDSCKTSLSKRDMQLYESISLMRDKIYGVPVNIKEGVYISKDIFLKILLSLKLAYS